MDRDKDDVCALLCGWLCTSPFPSLSVYILYTACIYRRRRATEGTTKRRYWTSVRVINFRVAVIAPRVACIYGYANANWVRLLATNARETPAVCSGARWLFMAWHDCRHVYEYMPSFSCPLIGLFWMKPSGQLLSWQYMHTRRCISILKYMAKGPHTPSVSFWSRCQDCDVI